MLADSIAENPMQFKILRDSVQELERNEVRTPASSVRLGVGCILLGTFRDAAECCPTRTAERWRITTSASRNRIGELCGAIESFNSAQKGGYNPDDVRLAVCRGATRVRQSDAALATLDALVRCRRANGRVSLPARQHGGADGWQPRRGHRAAGTRRAADRCMPERCLAWRWKTIDTATTSCLGVLRTRCRPFPHHVGSLLNLGIMYEDSRSTLERKSATNGFWKCSPMTSALACS